MALTIDKCTKCGEEKPITDFAPRKNRAKGYKSSCKACDKAYAAEWKRRKYASDPAYRQKVKESNASAREIRDPNYHTWNTYGITRDQYIDMMLEQDNCCGICEKPMLKRNVDHDHNDGRVRGLLCTPCNTGLGKLGDSIDGLKRAIAYLGGA